MTSKPIVSIFLIDAERASALSDVLSDVGIETVVVESSDALYQVLNYQRVDLVILANDLGGFLSGLDILERLYQDLLRPAVVLLGNLSRELQERARGLGIETILRSDSSLQNTRETIQGLLATSKIAQIVIAPEARKLVQRSDAIQPLPQVLVKLCGYLGDENASIVELAKDISVDPKITSNLLKLSNSASLGLRQKVNKVLDAVNLLGVRRTVSLVLSSSMIQTQSKLAKALPEAARTWYNSRSVLVASTAAVFARRLEDVSPDTAYVLGLMQDLGILVLAHAYGAKYLHTLHRVKDVGQLRLEIVEAQNYKITHGDVSAALLQKWELPQSMISMVLAHHTTEARANLSQVERGFLHAMLIGEAMANLSDRFTPQRHQILAQLLSAYGAGQADECKACLAEAVAKTAESKQLFALPVPENDGLKDILHKLSSRQSPREAQPNLPADGMSQTPVRKPNDSAESDGTLSEHGHRAAAPSMAGPAPDDEIVCTVVVIDDEPAVQKLISAYLSPHGIKVVSCDGYMAAQELAPRATAILCDVHLRSEDGRQVVRDLKRGGFTGPLIMISSDRSRQTVMECARVGATDYLLKPFGKACLVEKLRKHLPPNTAVTFDQESGGVPRILAESVTADSGT